MAVLTACSSPATNAAGCDAPVKEGDASKLVMVTGEFGAVPTVDFPTPLKTKTTQRSEIIAGKGDALVTDQKVKVDMSVYNGTSGESVEESAYDGSTLASFVLNDTTIRGITDGLQCAQEGSRVAVVVSPDDAFGPQGGNDQIGVAENDTLPLPCNDLAALGGLRLEWGRKVDGGRGAKLTGHLDELGGVAFLDWCITASGVGGGAAAGGQNRHQ